MREVEDKKQKDSKAAHSHVPVVLVLVAKVDVINRARTVTGPLPSISADTFLDPSIKIAITSKSYHEIVSPVTLR